MPERRIRIIDHRVVRGSDLLPNPENWRRHPPDQRAAITSVLDRLGYVDEVKAVETPAGLMLMDGHLRAQIGANDNVPVAVVDLNPEEQRLFLATFDPIAAMAITEPEVYVSLIEMISTEDDEILARLLAGVKEFNSPLTLPEDQEERDATSTAEQLTAVEAQDYQPLTQRGQVWVLGEHRLYCDEAPGPLLVLDVSDALVLTDPPYGISIVKGLGASDGTKPPMGSIVQAEYADKQAARRLAKLAGKGTTGSLRYVGKQFQQGKVGKPGVVEPRLYYPVHGDDQPFDPTWLLSLGKNQIIFGGTYFASKLTDGTSWLAWDKGIGDDATFSGFESAWTSFKGRFRLYRHKWSGMVRAGNRKEELKERVHPTQKPVGLFADILEDFEDYPIIVDPYLGSGTTIIAAEKLGRRCYAMEIEPRYCDVAIGRWQEYTGQQATLEGSDVTFDQLAAQRSTELPT